MHNKRVGNIFSLFPIRCLHPLINHRTPLTWNVMAKEESNSCNWKYYEPLPNLVMSVPCHKRPVKEIFFVPGFKHEGCIFWKNVFMEMTFSYAFLQSTINNEKKEENVKAYQGSSLFRRLQSIILFDQNRNISTKDIVNIPLH